MDPGRTWRACRANFKRALVVSFIVGTALLLINHGDHLGDEPKCASFFLKAIMCYVVPFTVSLTSAVMASSSSSAPS